MTIAYKPKSGYWSTRYSYDTSCFSTIDKSMLTFTEVLNGIQYNQNQVSYIHTDQSIPATFYDAPGGCNIRITANDNPSRNKVYRSMSMEGSLLQGSTTQFYVNESSQGSQLRTTYPNNVREKGGIFYSSVGKVIAYSNNNNLKVVGEIIYAYSTYGGDPSNPVDIASQLPQDQIPVQSQSYAYFQVRPIGGAFSSSTSQTENAPERVTKYLLGAKDADGVMRVVYPRASSNTTLYLPSDTLDGDPFWISNGVNTRVGNPQENLTPAWQAPPSYPKRVRNFFLIQVDAEDYFEYAGAGGNSGARTSTHVRNAIEAGDRIFLYEATEERLQGEDPRGQYANITINLPSNRFELYCVNVDYTTTELDHGRG